MMRTLLTALLCMGCPLMGMAELTEEAVAARVSELQTWISDQAEPPTPEAIKAKLYEVSRDIDVASLSMEEIARAAFLLLEMEAVEPVLRARLDTLSRQSTIVGVEAAIMRMFLSMRENGEDVGLRLGAVLEHSGLADALAAGKGYELFGVMEVMPKEALAANSVAIARLIDKVPEQLDAELLTALPSYVSVLGDLDERVSDERRQAVQDRVLAMYTSAIDRVRKDGREDVAQDLEGRLGYLRGAAARGELIGHPAPKLDLGWISSGEPVADLSAFKGKVVVLDFWATWCGPCLASFPNLRALRETYSPEQVIILGVTSLQGRHFPPDRPPVDTAGNPEREQQLMQEFMQEMDITWTVAFSRQDVFNQDFGVQGIPHVAIVAADGTVRYNGLSPHGDLTDNMSKIDGLLAESHP